MRPELRRILSAAIQAPSGENCQPWHFGVHGSTIEIYLVPGRDRSAYSWGQRASYLAIGAAIENLVIAASIERYRAPVRYFPDPSDQYHVATVTLVSEPSLPPDPLAEWIGARTTNRKPYAKGPLKNKERAALRNIELEGISVVMSENRPDIERLGRVGSTNEEVMLGNRSLHRFFFNHVNWTKEEDDRKKVGFYIKTLELPPPAQVMFRVFRKWPVMRVLRALGMNRLVAMQNGATNASAGAIAAFLVDAIAPQDFLNTGRAVERFWLIATSLGLSLQPLTGVLFFKLLMDGGDPDGIFSPAERSLIEKAYTDASGILGAEGKHIAFMCRVGRGPEPSARAVRFSVDEAVTLI